MSVNVAFRALPGLLILSVLGTTCAWATQLPLNLDQADAYLISDADAENIRGEAWSRNGFPKGQCTWYVDGRVKEAKNWTLKFSRTSGRDGWTWWDLVTNAGKGQLGLAGDIMVLNKWRSNPYGHVAYVESSTSGSSWNVTHANWASGSAVRTIEGYKVYKATFKKSSSSGYVKISGGSTNYPLRGFLYKK